MSKNPDAISALQAPQYTGMERLPTRTEAAAAAEILFRCNGYDLSTWTDDEWPSDEFSRAIKFLRAVQS
jgi:hypothetical protein